MKSNLNIKIGIYLISILMMGAIGISSSLSTIATRFPEYSKTMIISLISIPCLVIIPTTLISGKLMGMISKKMLVIIGITLFIIGGILPAFLNDFSIILIARGIFGVGIGVIQVLGSALVAENFEGAERDQVQGNMNSAQMLGCAVMVFAGGWLGSISWNYVFYVHMIAIISLVGAIVLIPYKKPDRAIDKGQGMRNKTIITSACWGWIALTFVFFISGQIYSNSLSFLVAELKIGTATEAGISLAFFAIGGFVMGLFFGKIVGIARKMTLGIGFIILSVSYLLLAFSSNILMINLGSFICGLSFSITMPCLIIGAANSVNSLSTGMAIAITMAMLNFAMFLSPYIINPIAVIFSDKIGMNANQLAIILGAVLIGSIGIFSCVWGILQNSKSIAESRII